MRTPTNEGLGSAIAETSGAGASAKDGARPERRCILTGRHGAPENLIRLAISPDGDVLPDPLARAPGRGAWLGVTRAELEAAMAAKKLRGALARAFKGAPLNVPDSLAQMIEDALVRSFLDRLGLEKRAGRLILGNDRIAEHARGGALAWLAHAADAGEDGSKKLDQAWRVGRDAEGSGERGHRLPLDRAALSVALGRDNVVHLALTDAKARDRVMVPLQRLETFLGAAPADGSAAGDDTPMAAAATGDDEKFEGSTVSL